MAVKYSGTFTLVTGAFTGVGQLAISKQTDGDGDVTVIHGNTAGDGPDEFSIKIRGHHSLTADDFHM